MELASNFGLWWDKEFLKTTTKLGVKIYSYFRYVDDTEMIVRALDLGTRFDGGQLVIKEDLVETDNDVQEDRRTMEEVANVASSIHSSIMVTSDYPSNRLSGRMPLLDLEVWVEEEEEVMFNFIEKPMASIFTIPVSSAQSWKQRGH